MKALNKMYKNFLRHKIKEKVTSLLVIPFEIESIKQNVGSVCNDNNILLKYQKN